MGSTYTSNTGLEKPGAGEQVGTWGNTANTNFNIIDRLTSGVGTITLSGTTHTLTTSDGALSDGQYKVLVFGGSPSGTNTVTISPNDQSKAYWVRNSSGQSIILTQGSGGNVTVADGESALVYADGGGAGAAVVDLTSFLQISVSNLDGVTATAAELNILDGVTATAAELNILDGVTATTAELNILDGVTATTAELNYNDITTLGTSQPSKVVTADANGNVKLAEELQVTSYIETVVPLSGTTPTVDCDEANSFTLTTSGNTTFTFDYSGINLTTDDSYGFTLKVTAGGTHTLSWPTSVNWPGGTAPDAPASGETDIFVFYTVDGGTTWYGLQAGNALA
jgi:hypothetical protein